jgi:hypothetical protein
MMNSKPTRQSTNCQLIGPPSNLPTADLPTLRQVLQKCCQAKLDSPNPKWTKITDVLSIVESELTAVWGTVNPKLPLIGDINRKIKTAYENYVFNKKPKQKISTVDSFKSRLDKLFDICSCKCEFIGHLQNCPENCDMLHISCKCPLNYKIPRSELAFIKDQREKVGGKGKYQLGPIDKAFERKRKRAEARTDQHRSKKPADLGTMFGESFTTRVSSTSSDDSNDSVFADPETSTSSEYMDLTNLAREADRYNSSDRETAALATAILIDKKIITGSDIRCTVTRSMVRHARAKYRKSVKILSDDPIRGVYFDGRKDDTNTKDVDESGTMRYSKIKEEHYCLTSEPSGTYMTHFAPADGKAQTICDNVYTAMSDMGASDSVEVIGSDSTNTMSGADGGAQHFLEVKLYRNLFRVLCLLHTNETPLRNLFVRLDGPTSGKDCFKGPIGKALKVIKSFPLKTTFPAITDGDAVPILPDEVHHDLSWDQKCQYKLLHAVRSGKSNTDIANIQIGPLNHSRFLTLAERCLYLYMCEHDLSEEDTEKLYKIVHFIMTNYGPMWFHIKIKPLLTDAPRHIFQQTQLLKLLPDDVLDIVKPYVSRNCYHAHPENLLLSMLDDDDESIRKKAVSTILDIRSRDPSLTRPVRPFRVPKLRYDADTYHELIDWKNEILTEPPLTYNLSDDMLKNIIEVPLEIPPYRSHTQSIERVIKLVTNASGKTYGLHSASGYIKAQISSRQLYKKGDTKKELIKMLDK